MKCAQCGNEFEPKRATAKFCSTVCRVKANRQEGEPVPPAETIKKDYSPEELTPDGQVRQRWDRNNPVPNLEGGYFHIGQTKEEYLENLPEVGFKKDHTPCEHPETEQFWSKCLLCGQVLRYVRVGESFQKATKKDTIKI